MGVQNLKTRKSVAESEGKGGKGVENETKKELGLMSGLGGLMFFYFLYV